MRRFKGWLRIGAGAGVGSGCPDRRDGADIDLTLGVPGHSSLDEAHAPGPLASRRLRLDFDVSAERPGIAEQALEREPAELSSQQLG